MEQIVWGLGLLVIVASLLPRLRRDEWWIRVFDFPRLQLLTLGLLALGLFAWGIDSPGTLEMILLVGLLASIAVQAFRIIPYTLLAPREVISESEFEPEATISVLVANVLMGNRQSEGLLRMIRRLEPDLVLTLEPDAWWEKKLDEIDYPYVVSHPLDNRYGISLRSCLPLLDPEVRHVVKDDIPSIRTRIRLRDGRLVSFYGLHPEPPSPTEAPASTERDAELLIVGREVRDEKLPVIVTGDLNDVAWSHTTNLFRRTSGLLDPRRGRGMFNTFHASVPFLRFPLDHVFHSADFLLVTLRRLSKFGSDHFPIYCRLSLSQRAPLLQDEPTADTRDREEAQEKIKRVEASSRGRIGVIN